MIDLREEEIVDAEIVDEKSPTVEENENKVEISEEDKEDITNKLNEILSDIDMNEMMGDMEKLQSPVKMYDEILEKQKEDIEKLGLEVEDVKDFLLTGSPKNLFAKTLNVSMNELVNLEPNILTVLYTTEPIQTTENTVITDTTEYIRDGIKYRLKDEFTEENLVLKDYYLKEDQTRDIVKYVFLTPELFKTFETLEKSEFIKDKVNVISGLQEIYKRIVDIYYSDYMKEHLKHARASVSEEFLNVEKVLQYYKEAKENNISSGATVYVREKFEKKVKKISKKIQTNDFFNMLDVLTQFMCVKNNKVNKKKKKYLFHSLVKTFVDCINDNNYILVVSFMIEVANYVEYVSLNAMRDDISEAEYKELEELEKEVKLSDLTAFVYAFESNEE